MFSKQSKSKSASTRPGRPFFGGKSIFPKLTVNAPNDAYEQQADAMADSIMRMEEEEEQLQAMPLENALQRKCAACEEEEEKVQSKPFLRKVEGRGGSEASPELAGQLDESKGGGAPLPEATQGRMGRAFGADFSHVKVHTGSRAAAMSQGIQAKAFTHGSDIYFNEGQYQPETSSGSHLLAHELTHVVQQGGQGHIQRSLLGGLLGAGIGGALGAGIGAGIGYAVGGGLGALIGGGIGLLAGGLAGGLIGHAATNDRDRQALRRPNRPLPQSLEALRTGDISLLSEREIENTREYQEYMSPGSIWQTGLHLTAAEARLACLLLLQAMRNSPGVSWSEATARQYALAARARIQGSSQNIAQDQLAHEIEVTSMEGARRIFNEMSNLTFLNEQDQATPIPFHYPPDGCYARAELMAARLTALGYASGRKFAISRNPGLSVETDYSVDTATAGETPVTTWWYHVAPIIKAEQSNGEIIDMVIDPSIANGPLSVEEWTGLMSGQTFTERSLEEVRNRVGSGGGFESNTTFSTSRASVGPSDLDQPSRIQSPQERIDEARAVLSQYANYAPAHELAQIIRSEMRNSDIDAGRILLHIQTMSRISRDYFKQEFHSLKSRLESRLSAEERARINSALNSP
ncbi:MAG: DUF4157 domain-containing protein [Phaeodactylibacter sp.]|nr:DUF4157 domain-containing protein [Phaeodactylibacter sp.]